MPSNINPSLEPTKSLVNFRFWCQKVLPLVYDDSLSYYEVLGKMVVQLNDVIDNVNADTENVLTLKDAFLELQTYVNNFFDDIDQLASYAERAEAAQTAANASAVNAATSASNASASSLAAMNARDAAVAAKQTAQTSENNASTAATNANTKANEAAQSAITAQTAQASASQSATLAATDRSAAQTAANTATTKASEASTSATNAETSANNAAQSKEDAEEAANNIQENLDNIQQNTQDINDLKESLVDEIESLGKTFNVTWNSGYTINGNTTSGAFSISEYNGRRYAGPFKSLTDFAVIPTRNVSVIATDENGQCTLNTGWFSDKRTIEASLGKNFYILCSFDNNTDVPDVLVEGELTGIESLKDVIKYVISNNVFEFSRGTTSDGVTFTDSIWIMYQTYISILPFDLTIPVNTVSRINLYTYSDTKGTNPVQHWDSNVNSDYTITANTPFRMVVMYRSGVSGTQLADKAGMYESPLYKSLVFYAGKYAGYNLMDNIESELIKLRHITLNDSFRVVNHRGYSQQYPENTILAFKKSKERGFKSVETDVRFTSDNIAVLLHDDSINRTARNADGTSISGTVNIADITYEQALTYDFGIWKDSAYAGEKIPTFEQFITLCKSIGLHPYIELKTGTQAQINELCNIVIKHGMRKNVTWISYAITLLTYVKTADKGARIGLISNTITAQNITDANSLLTDKNEIFIATDYNNVTDSIVEICVASDIPMEVFAVDDYNSLINLNSYFTGITTNWLLANDYLYKSEMMN